MITTETAGSTSCESSSVTDEHEEGEIIEKEEDSDTLITNDSSLHSSLTLPSSSCTPPIPATYVPEKPSCNKELCPIFTSTGTNIYNLDKVCGTLPANFCIRIMYCHLSLYTRPYQARPLRLSNQKITMRKDSHVSKEPCLDFQ